MHFIFYVYANTWGIMYHWVILRAVFCFLQHPSLHQPPHTCHSSQSGESRQMNEICYPINPNNISFSCFYGFHKHNAFPTFPGNVNIPDSTSLPFLSVSSSCQIYVSSVFYITLLSPFTGFSFPPLAVIEGYRLKDIPRLSTNKENSEIYAVEKWVKYNVTHSDFKLYSSHLSYTVVLLFFSSCVLWAVLAERYTGYYCK